MESETLEDHVRRVTRNFTSVVPEDQVLALGRDLARELARAHAESPPRHPDLEPRAIAMDGGVPRLTGGTAEGDAAEDLFRLGALLSALGTFSRHANGFSPGGSITGRPVRWSASHMLDRDA